MSEERLTRLSEAMAEITQFQEEERRDAPHDLTIHKMVTSVLVMRWLAFYCGVTSTKPADELSAMQADVARMISSLDPAPDVATLQGLKDEADKFFRAFEHVVTTVDYAMHREEEPRQ